MLGGVSGFGNFLGLLADIVRGVLGARKKREAQERYEAVESDPAGEFIARYGVRGSETREPPPSASPADPGKRGSE